MPLRRDLPMLIIGLLVMTSTGGALAQEEGPGAPDALAGTRITYQGELRNGGSPVTATCDFKFSLYDGFSLGAQVGATQTVTGVSVVGGRFTVTLNAGGEFGARAFDGSARWLAVAVKCPPDSGFTPLIQRQPLTAAPLALALPGLRTEPNATSPNVIGGSISNTVSLGKVGATIGGGGETTLPNSINGDWSTIGGGEGNVVSDSWSTIGGGVNNIVSGRSATVPGGLLNEATGFASFAAGGKAHAVTDGSFVWSGWEQFADPISSTVENEFLVRASGGVTLYTNSTATIGAALYPGSSSWSIISDRNQKANFASVDGLQVLNALAGIPIESWNFKTQDGAIRHMGPMAQDFHAAFGLGENDTTISTVDAQGVAMAAIQGLYSLVQQKDAQIAAQQGEITTLRAAVTTLQAGQADTNARLATVEGRASWSLAQLPLVLPWLLLAGLGLMNVGAAAGYLAARARRA